ncbi:MAG: MBOAT family O-acyltransferase [Rhodospirillaceae bacterium]
MLFNSHIFLLIFLPAVFTAFHLLPPRFRLALLLAASLVFYAWADLKPALFMVLSMIWVHVTTAWPAGLDRRARSALLVAFLTAVLFLFRFLDFTLGNVGAGEETRRAFSFFLDVAVPAGISFYTLQIIAYGIDVVLGRIERERSFVKFATFIAYFSQLIAGPIVRYRQVADQFAAIGETREIAFDFVGAFRLIAIGLVMKVFGTDVMALLAQQFELSPAASGTDALISVLAYSFCIYFDFFAYSTIAIGLGRLYGIELPVNFQTSYHALNPKDFWRRWHVTLSFWLRDYVYIALGGNRAYVRNILIVFVLCGLWHGAAWNFVV